MRIEGVIVCKDYSDFLAHSLAENAHQLDDIIVVTSHDDKKTQAVCAKHSVDCVKTDAFQEKGHTFNKGQAINIGLDHLRGGGWILHLDADIVLCKDFRRMLEHSQLDPKNIYGADRINVYGYENWMKLKPMLGRHYQDRWFIDPGFCHAPTVPEGVRLGARVVHKEYGYVPIGFFQLWHSSAGHRYNVKRGAAAGTDIMFPLQWPRQCRQLLPEVVVYHLDSEPTHGIGTNWKGRASRPFEPATVTEGMLNHGHRHHPPHCHHKHRCRHPHCHCDRCYCDRDGK